MISKEPVISVGILEGRTKVRGVFQGPFALPGGLTCEGQFSVEADGKELVLYDSVGKVDARGIDISCRPGKGSRFLLHDVEIGVKFHWERREDQVFEGGLRVVAGKDGTIVVINAVPLEPYLKSVISSEMSAESPLELLKAHAMTSRSWLVAMLERGRERSAADPEAGQQSAVADEVIRWYSREDHDLYDVCADDHCQRYQGVTKIISDAADNATRSTHGLFLVYDGRVCDARYYKACGGITEEFRNSWEETDVPYLTSISDGPSAFNPVRTEHDAKRWILSRPDAYCNTGDPEILTRVLPSFDQETHDFFRWKVEYKREELEDIIRKKSGREFGLLLDLVPLQRGPSGRLVRLKVVGSEQTIVVGKDLEIRRWLSPSHLYSSAFVVSVDRDSGGLPVRFVLDGAGWGHGVGLCQIGAAVMASRGFSADTIVRHYFRGADVQKLY